MAHRRLGRSGGREALRGYLDQRDGSPLFRHRSRQHVRILGLGGRPLLAVVGDRLADRHRHRHGPIRGAAGRRARYGRPLPHRAAGRQFAGVAGTDRHLERQLPRRPDLRRPALRSVSAPPAGVSAAGRHGEQRQVRDQERRARRLHHRSGSVRRARHQRPALVLPAHPPEHAVGAVRLHRTGAESQPDRRAPRDPALQLLRADRSADEGQDRSRGASRTGEPGAERRAPGGAGPAPGFRRQSPEQLHPGARRRSVHARYVDRALRAQDLHARDNLADQFVRPVGRRTGQAARQGDPAGARERRGDLQPRFLDQRPDQRLQGDAGRLLMRIRRLPESLINRIAAGEVVERPASAVKELVENSLDAGATRIEITLREGGRTLIMVADDGCGMGSEELALAVERHATSKLPDDNLSRIATLGFRGEALPSIGAVSRLTVTSRPSGVASAWTISIEGGRVSDARPTAHPPGTRVEVRGLFFATPARLKFLKAPPTEVAHAVEAINRLAMARPEVGFILTQDGRSLLALPPDGGDAADTRLRRLEGILGREFAANAVPVAAEREGVRLDGFAGLPTLHRRSAASQFLFVNDRPVRDRLLHGAVRGAYHDLVAHDRHPVVALFLEVPPELVDVNVHPMKTEVRFRDQGLVRGLIVASLRHALAAAGHRAATSATSAPWAGAPRAGAQSRFPLPPNTGLARGFRQGLAEEAAPFHAPLLAEDVAPGGPARPGSVPVAEEVPPLGFP